MSDNFKERRKHQRISVKKKPDNEVSLSVAGYGPTHFFDVSYKGAALSQPSDRRLNKIGEIIKLDIKSDQDHGQLKAQVVRFNDQGVGVHFKTVDYETQIILDRMVTDRIVGKSMKQMSPEDFGSDSDFHHWFHGPKETNLYFWIENDFIKKAQLDMGFTSLIYEDDIFIFENRQGFLQGQVKLNNRQINLKALAIVEEMDLSLNYLKNFYNLLKSQTGV